MGHHLAVPNLKTRASVSARQPKPMKPILLAMTLIMCPSFFYGQQPTPTATPRLKSLRGAEMYREKLERSHDKGDCSKEAYSAGIDHYKKEISRLKELGKHDNAAGHDKR